MDYPCSIVTVESEEEVTGEELRRIRKRLGWTQVQLADRVGVVANTVARWERNEVPIQEPAARLIRLLAAGDVKAKRGAR